MSPTVGAVAATGVRACTREGVATGCVQRVGGASRGQGGTGGHRGLLVRVGLRDLRVLLGGLGGHELLPQLLELLLHLPQLALPLRNSCSLLPPAAGS